MKKVLLHVFLLMLCTTGFSQVLINEISPDPANLDGVPSNQTGEFIELYNAGASAVDIGGWILADGDAAIRLPSGSTIAAGGFYLVASYGLNSGSGGATNSGISCNTCDFKGITVDANWGLNSPNAQRVGTNVLGTNCSTAMNPTSSPDCSGDGNKSENWILFDASGDIKDAVYWGTNNPCSVVAATHSLPVFGSLTAISVTVTVAPFNGASNVVVTTGTGTTNSGNIAWKYAGSQLNGCNSSYQRQPNGGNWASATLNNTSLSTIGTFASGAQPTTQPTNHPTPRASNTSVPFTFSVAGIGLTLVTSASDPTQVQEYQMCTAAPVTFTYVVNNYQNVQKVINYATTRIGSYVTATGAGALSPTAWTVTENSPAAGQTTLTYTVTPLTGATTYQLVWEDYIESCCGGSSYSTPTNLSSCAWECYESRKVKITVVPPMTASKTSVSCPSDFTAGTVNIGSLIMGGNNVTYELYTGGTAGTPPTGGTLQATNTTGVFNLPISYNDVMYVKVIDATGCTTPLYVTINSNCKAAPVCPTLVLNTSTTTASGAKCPGDVISLCIDAASTNLPVDGLITWYKGSSPSFGISSGTIVAQTSTTQSFTYLQNFDALPNTTIATGLTCSSSGGTSASTTALDLLDVIGLSDWKMKSSNDNYNIQDATNLSCFSYGALANFVGSNNDNFIGSKASSATGTLYYGFTYTIPTLPCTGTVTEIKVQYVGKQVAMGYNSSAGNPALGDQPNLFDYGVGNLAINASTGFTNVSALNNSVINTAPVGTSTYTFYNYPNMPRKIVSGKITGLTLSTGNTITFRWRDPDDVSNDHIMSQDSILLTFVVTGGNCSMCSNYTVSQNDCNSDNIYFKAQVTPSDGSCTNTITAAAGPYAVTCPTATFSGGGQICNGIGSPASSNLTINSSQNLAGYTVTYLQNGTSITSAALSGSSPYSIPVSTAGTYEIVSLNAPIGSCAGTITGSPLEVTVKNPPLSYVQGGCVGTPANMPTVQVFPTDIVLGSVTYNVTSMTPSGTVPASNSTGIFTFPAGTTAATVEMDNGGCKTSVNLSITACPPIPALPVELLSFAGVRKSQGVDLFWKIGVEQNVQQYIIERSLDGSNFAPIGSVAAKGLFEYNYFDASAPKGILYYRLKVQDKDGKLELSSILKMNGSGADSRSLSVFPVPAHNKVNLAYYSPIAESIKLSVYTASGALVAEKDNTVINGTNVLPIFIDKYAPGVYFIKIKSSLGVQTILFIKD